VHCFDSGSLGSHLRHHGPTRSCARTRPFERLTT
jgi:hypothetical protein